MFPRLFSTKLRLTILISVVTVVSCTNGAQVTAQTKQASVAERLDSLTERRIREQMKGKRKFLVGEPANHGAAARFELRLRQELNARRSNAGVQPTPITPVDAISADAVPDERTFGIVDLSEPLEVRANNQTIPRSMVETSESPADDTGVQFSHGRELASLESFEQLAIENHPTLNAAVARILTARHEALQAGLHPNPQLGMFIDELGNDNDPGLWGAYVQRNIVRGNKLTLGRKVKSREAGVLEIKFESQVLRIKTDVRTAFYDLLIAREKHQLATQLYTAQQNAVSKARQLFESGETPKTDLLQTELQAQKALILMNDFEVLQQNGWRKLAAVVGQPELLPRPITGSFEPIAKSISYEYCLEQILTNSPELLSAKAEVQRVRSTIDQELANSIPNYQTQISLGRDANSNHFFTGVQLQVPLQFYDRNQGNIAAAKSRLVVAQNNVDKIKLNLSKRLATEYQLYQSAVVKSDLYSNELLPNAQQTLDLLASGYPEEVSFLRLVTAQQTVIDITIEFLNAIQQRWTSQLRIEGLLLDDSLGQ